MNMSHVSKRIVRQVIDDLKDQLGINYADLGVMIGFQKRNVYNWSTARYLEKKMTTGIIFMVALHEQVYLKGSNRLKAVRAMPEYELWMHHLELSLKFHKKALRGGDCDI